MFVHSGSCTRGLGVFNFERELADSGWLWDAGLAERPHW